MIECSRCHRHHTPAPGPEPELCRPCLVEIAHALIPLAVEALAKRTPPPTSDVRPWEGRHHA